VNSPALKRGILPVLVLLAVAIIALAAGYFTKADAKATAPGLSAPEPQRVAVRGEIRQVTGDQITVSTREGARTFRIVPTTVFETLGTTTTLHLDVGDDWLNVGAIQHPQTLFVVNGLVVISEAGPP
jgi:hypothetical protein